MSQKLDLTGLPVNVQATLAKAGVETVADVEVLGPQGLMSINGIGEKLSAHVINLAAGLGGGDLTRAKPQAEPVSLDRRGDLERRKPKGTKVFGIGEPEGAKFYREKREGDHLMAYESKTISNPKEDWLLKGWLLQARSEDGTVLKEWQPLA
jgi:hypothetical protein